MHSHKVEHGQAMGNVTPACQQANGSSCGIFVLMVSISKNNIIQYIYIRVYIFVYICIYISNLL